MDYVPFLRLPTNSREMAIIASMVMLVGGTITLLYGWRLYRILLVIACGLAAGYIGWYFLHGHVPEMLAIVGPVVLGLIGAMIAFPLQKAVVFLLGSTVGFVSLGPVLAEYIWSPPEGPTPTHYLICAAGAFVVMGILALILFRPIMVAATSMFGASLILSAVVHAAEVLSTPRRNIFGNYGRELAWVYAGLTVVGIIFQWTVMSKQKKTD